MENYSIVIFIMAVMIILSAFADKVRLPYPVLLITAGIAIGFVPAIPAIELDPDVVFLIFLPPLLYDAAFNISFKDFRVHLNTISTLAIGLVFITTLGIAAIAHYCIPGMNWPLSFVLGAILSATDAVAAMGVTKGLGLSHKTTTILEGESLVNDASALIAYRFAVAALTGVTFVLWKAYLQFLIVLVGGFAVGFVIGRLLGFVLARVRSNALVTLSFMLLMPFVVYLVAEELHLSGVIAVVTLGLIVSRTSNLVFADHLKQQMKAIWDVIIFLLNGLIFVLIGLEFPYILKSMGQERVLPYIGYSFLIFLVTLVLRMARVFLQRIRLDKAFRRNKGKRKISEDMLLDVPTSLIITWSGMRGIVSLAIAIGLPVVLDNGETFPQRNVIIFISVTVVLFTLLVQGLTLPWLVQYLKKNR
jgi:Na+/H+ antiporter